MTLMADDTACHMLSICEKSACECVFEFCGHERLPARARLCPSFRRGSD